LRSSTSLPGCSPLFLPKRKKSLPSSFPPQGISLAAEERDLIHQALEQSGGNQVRAARLLGISRDVLRYRMKKLNPF
jgi:two-component system response regulator AtoC